MVIAIDGPAGSGKSTIAKRIAKKLNFEHLDTGSMYRVITYYMLVNKIEITDEKQVNEHLKNINITIKNNQFFLNDQNVCGLIRSEEISKLTSKIATYFEVRQFLLAKQQKLAMNKSLVVDGRDTTTVVFPKAEIKIYLTATPEIRAKRRYLQNIKRKITANYEQILLEIKKRDYQDQNRTYSPLKIADDAIVIDSSNIHINKVIGKILKIYEEFK